MIVRTLITYKYFPKKKKSRSNACKNFKLKYDDLNFNEKLVLNLLNGKGKGERVAWRLKTLAINIESPSYKQSYLKAVQILSKLVKAGVVVKVKRGMYKITYKGRLLLKS